MNSNRKEADLGTRQQAVAVRNRVVTYKAFISYSHSADSSLAPRLQSALQTFGKPWYLPRAFRIFRDTTNLSLVPELWREIEEALEAAEFLLLLASPAAAGSKWVKKELAYWKERKSPSSLMLILTSGKIVWDDAAGDFDPILSTAIPPELYRTFPHEPLWLDFSTLHGERLSITDAQFLDHIATVAAPFHGKTKDEMFGEHIRQRRRTIQLVAFAALLLVAALLVTLWQWQVARRQRDLALQREAEVRETLSRADYTAAASLFQQDEAHTALLYLIRAVEQNPANSSAAQRLVSALTSRRWPILIRQPSDAGGSMVDARFLADGKRIISASWGGGMRVFDSLTGDPIFAPMLPPPGPWADAGLSGMTVSEKLEMVASFGTSGSLHLWSLRDGSSLRAIPVDSSPLRHGSFSPDGAWLAALSEKGMLRVYRTPDFSQAWEAALGSGTLLRFSADGTSLLAGTSEGRVIIHKSSDGKLLAEAQGPKSLVTTAAWSPDGASVAIGFHEGVVAHWAWTSPAPWTLTSTMKPPGFLASLAEPGKGIGGFGYYPSISWTVAELTKSQQDEEGWKFEHPIREAGFYRSSGGWGGFDIAADQGLLMTYHSMDRFARLWSILDRKPWSEPLIHSAGVRAATFSSDRSRILTASGDPNMRLWTVKGPLAPSSEFKLPLRAGEFVTKAEIDRTGTQILVASRDNARGTIRHFEYIEREKSAKLVFERSIEEFVASLGMREDGGAIAWTDTSGMATALESATGRQLWKYATGLTDCRITKFLSLAGTVLIAGKGSSVWLLDSSQSRQIELGESADVAMCAAVSADGEQVALGIDSGHLRILRVADGSSVRNWSAHLNSLSDLAFSPDGKRLVSASYDHYARQWDAKTGKEVQPGMQTEGELLGVTYSQDGRWVVTFGRDDTARIWDSGSGRLAAPPLRHRAWVNDAWFSSDGLRVVTTTLKGTMHFWDRATGLQVADEVSLETELAAAWSSRDGTKWMTLDKEGCLRWGRSGALPDETALRQIAKAAAPLAGREFNQNGGTEAREAAMVQDWDALARALESAR